MVTKEKLEEFRQRMHHHKVVDDRAVVELSAREMQELLDYINELEEALMGMAFRGAFRGE